jgi:hypothetical protein
LHPVPARSRSPRRARLLRSAFVALPLVLLAAGCSTPGDVNDYNTDTEDNFMLACEDANSGLGAAEATERCGCWYEEISTTIAFEDFETIEDDIREALDAGDLDRDGLEAVSDQFYDVITDEQCVPVGPELN